MNLLLQLAQTVNYYDGPSSSAASGTAEASTVAAIFGFILLMVVVTYVLVSYLLSRIFKKAGVEPWKAWVPIYNNWITLELGGQNGFWAVLTLVPIINIVSSVFMLIAMYHIGLKFGKEGSFVLLAIFLPLVWYAWLALDASTWNNRNNQSSDNGPTNAPPYQPPRIL